MDKIIDFQAFLDEGERLKNMNVMDFDNIAEVEATAYVKMADNSYYVLEYQPSEHGMVYVNFFDYRDREQDFDLDSYEFRAFLLLVREKLGWLCDQNQRFMDDWRSFSEIQAERGFTPRTLAEHMEHMDELVRMEEDLEEFNNRMDAIPHHCEIMDALIENDDAPMLVSEIVEKTGLPEDEIRASLKKMADDPFGAYFLNDRDVFGDLTYEFDDGERVYKPIAYVGWDKD